jgi:hypothetical protein
MNSKEYSLLVCFGIWTLCLHVSFHSITIHSFTKSLHFPSYSISFHSHLFWVLLEVCYHLYHPHISIQLAAIGGFQVFSYWCAFLYCCVYFLEVVKCWWNVFLVFISLNFWCSYWVLYIILFAVKKIN